MKLKPIILLGAAIAVACSALLARQEIRTRWQYDDIREHNRIARAREVMREQFYKTNTNPEMGTIREVWTDNVLTIPSATNAIELGYRDDGIVVWRTPPEAR